MHRFADASRAQGRAARDGDHGGGPPAGSRSWCRSVSASRAHVTCRPGPDAARLGAQRDAVREYLAGDTVKLSIRRHEPMGVVTAITPYNFPFTTTCGRSCPRS